MRNCFLCLPVLVSFFAYFYSEFHILVSKKDFHSSFWTSQYSYFRIFDWLFHKLLLPAMNWLSDCWFIVYLSWGLISVCILAFWLIGFFEWWVNGFPTCIFFFPPSLALLTWPLSHSHGIKYRIRFPDNVSRDLSNEVQWWLGSVPGAKAVFVSSHLPRSIACLKLHPLQIIGNSCFFTLSLFTRGGGTIPAIGFQHRAWRLSSFFHGFCSAPFTLQNHHQLLDPQPPKQEALCAHHFLSLFRVCPSSCLSCF